MIVLADDLFRFGQNLGREVDEVFFRRALPLVRRRLGRMGLRRRHFSPGAVEGGTGRSSIGHTGLPVTRSKTNVKPVFVICATALIGLPSTLISHSTGAPGRS